MMKASETVRQFNSINMIAKTYKFNRVRTFVSQTFMSRQKQSKMQKVSKTFGSQTKLSQIVQAIATLLNDRINLISSQ